MNPDELEIVFVCTTCRTFNRHNRGLDGYIEAQEEYDFASALEHREITGREHNIEARIIRLRD